MTVAPISGHTDAPPPSALGGGRDGDARGRHGWCRADDAGHLGFNADDEAFANWKGVVVGVGLFGGVIVAFTAFGLAVIAKVLREHWMWLWLPLLFGPVLNLSMPLWFE